jgi:hypothetical protein
MELRNTIIVLGFRTLVPYAWAVAQDKRATGGTVEAIECAADRQGSRRHQGTTNGRLGPRALGRGL